MSGLVQVFTGNGKGKTSAALGVVMRCLGHGMRTHVTFFMKGEFPYGEQEVLARLPNVTFGRFGHVEFVDPQNVKPDEREQARQALEDARKAVMSGEYDLVVLDEVNVAAAWGLVDVEDVVALVEGKPERTEIILTGRYADERIVQLADLVTEMREVKHPFQKGVTSRKGMDY